MTSTTIERNYKKNPHTATWLQTFHAAAQGLPSDIDAAEDLLDEVPVEAPAFRPSAGQINLMSNLIGEIRELGANDAYGQALDYCNAMDAHNAWTPENTKRWIDRLIAKKRALVAADLDKVASQEPVQVADGRYAVEEGGTLKFFKVKNGRRPGFVFLDIQASDEWHSVRDLTRIRRILAEIAKDAEAAMARYGREIGECGKCGRTLTSEYRELGIGPICISK